MVIKNHGFTRSEKVGLSSIIAFLLVIVLAGCASDTSGPAVKTTEPVAVLTGYEGCINLQYRPTDDCLEYEYTSDGTLRLWHLGAAFNCCPGEIYADITITENEIIVVEKERESACRCLCLFAIDYEVTNLKSGTYEIRVIEPYLTEGDESLVCTIDLPASPSGSCCVKRDHYPWE